MIKTFGNCDRLWKFWYILFVLCIYTFLIYNTIRQYMEYKTEAYTPLYGGNWSETPLNLAIALLLFSLSLIPVIAYAGLFKVGHLANDGLHLGVGPENSKSGFPGSSSIKMNGHNSLRRSLNRHFVPFACILHVLSAYALLVALPPLHAEQLKHEAIDPESVWQSDLDILFGSPTIATTTEPGEVRRYPTKIATVTPEFANFVLSLCILVIRYPAPFWYTSRAFSIVFSVFLFLSSIYSAVDYSALQVLYKVSKVELIEKDKFDPKFPPWVCLGLSASGFFFTVLMQIAVYEYGLIQFVLNLCHYRPYPHGDIEIDSIKKMPCLQRFWPNIMSALMLIIVISCKAPTIWQFMSLYWGTGSGLMLAAVVVSIMYLVAWVLLWVCFTVKMKWNFQIILPAHTPIPHQKYTDSYGCYHDNPALSHSSSNSDPNRPAVSNGSECSKISGHDPSNYVFLHPSFAGIAPVPELPMNEAESEASYDAPSSRSSNNPPNGRCPGDIMVRRGSNPVTNYTTLASISANDSPALSDHNSFSLSRQQQARRNANRVTFKDQQGATTDNEIRMKSPREVDTYDEQGMPSAPDVYRSNEEFPPDILATEHPSQYEPADSEHQSTINDYMENYSTGRNVNYLSLAMHGHLNSEMAAGLMPEQFMDDADREEQKRRLCSQV